MPHNLLDVPLRRTSQPPIRQALRTYVNQKHPETHPEAFEWDISEWESQRKGAISMDIHEDTIPHILSYHAQLVYLLTKLPPDIGLSFSYEQMFATGSPVAISNLYYERASILLNLACLFSQLGTSEDRVSEEGIKRAVAHFAKGAGTISYLLANVISPLRRSLENAGLPMPLDLNEGFLKFLRGVMIAEAQECAWQKARLAQMRNGIQAKLAAQASKFYSECLGFIDLDTRLSSYIPKNVIAHLRCKYHHFAAVAQYRLSVDDGVDRKYGIQISRLDIAARESKAAMDSASWGKASPEILSDTKSLNDRITAELRQISHENDLIYHQDVLPASAVPTIPGHTVVTETIIPQLSNPASVIGGAKSKTAIFGGLEGWGIRRACDIFKNRRDNCIDDELVGLQHEYDVAAMKKLNALNLPASLDALSQPIGLPPSLLQQADQVRSENGPDRIMKMLEDSPMLANRCREIIEEAFDALDQEAEEDEELRTAYAKHDEWTRPSSKEANSALTQRAQAEVHSLGRAAESDRALRAEWEEWEDLIYLLARDEADLEEEVPQSTTPVGVINSRSGNTREHSETRIQARTLRQLLEQLDELKVAREAIISRAKRQAAKDDIKPNVMRKANTFDNWTQIGPEVFEDVVNEGLLKYDKFKDDLEENAAAQEGILARIEEQNERFLSSRKEDPVIKKREEMLKSLSNAYQAYVEIKRGLEENINFYNNEAVALNGFRSNVNEWVDERRAGVRWLIDCLVEVPKHLASPSGSRVSAPVKIKTEAPPVPPEEPKPSPQPAKERPHRGNETSTSPFSPPVTSLSPGTRSGGKPAGGAATFSIPSPFSGKWEETPNFSPEPSPRPPKTPSKKKKAKQVA